MNEEFVGIGEVSKILGLSRTSVQKRVDSGQLVVVSSMSQEEIERHGGLDPRGLLLEKPLNLSRLRGFVDAHVQIFQHIRHLG